MPPLPDWCVVGAEAVCILPDGWRCFDGPLLGNEQGPEFMKPYKITETGADDLLPIVYICLEGFGDNKYVFYNFTSHTPNFAPVVKLEHEQETRVSEHV